MAFAGIYEYSPLLVNAQLVKEKTISDAKKVPELMPQFQVIMKLLKEQYKYLWIKEPRAILEVVESQFSGVNDGVIPIEKVYDYGRVIIYIKTKNFWVIASKKQIK